MRGSSFAARAIERLSPRMKDHVRSRALPLGAIFTCAVAISSYSAAWPESTPEGVAHALGAATHAEVDPRDFVWGPSRGALLDALWGREVTFLARKEGTAEPAPRDVMRARFSVAPGGRPLAVRSVVLETATPLADEHDLVARGDSVAWLTRGRGGDHGATLSRPAEIGRLASTLRGAIPLRSHVHVVFANPADSAQIELHADALVLAARHGDSEGRARLDEATLDLATSGSLTDSAVVRRAAPVLRAPWSAAPPKVRRAAPSPVVAPVDVTVFPPPFAWQAIASPRVLVAAEHAAPAPVVRAVVAQGGVRVVLTGFDSRQLALRVIPGPDAPVALAGLPGTARLPSAEHTRLVGSAAVSPVRGALPGAIERGRVIAPPGLEAPRIAADERGSAFLAASPSVAPFGVVQTGEPAAGEPVAAWCQTSAGAIVVAVSEPPDRPAIEKALAPLACRAVAWVADGEVDAEPRVEDARTRDRGSFAAFLRVREFPDGRQETWMASPGRQPFPAFRPAILERQEVVFGERVRVTAFVGGRFAWMLRAGTRERSHRAGGTFPAAIEGDALARALAAIDLGIGERRRPNGLTIGGSTGHPYASRGAVLLADERGLSLVPSAELREDPRGDGVELPLTASGGSPTPRALTRGLTQQRGDLCVLPDGTLLVALATFDSHAASAEALCRLGCSEVAALDRGLDMVPTLARAASAPLLPAHPATRLIALDRGSPQTP